MKHLNIALLILSIVSCYSITAQSNTLIISEIMSCNEDAVNDSFENSPDWIEIFNKSTNTIDLSNYFLSDDDDDLEKWSFPSENIQAGEYLLLFASKKDTIIDSEMHSNFKLNSDGECLFLSNTNGLVDFLCFPELLCNQSYGVESVNETSQAIFFDSTPGFQNEMGGIDLPISFSHEAGFYTDSFYLSINTLPGYDIKYTTDGSEPDENSILYQAPIPIKSRIGQPNIYSEIQASPINQWANPLEEVFK